MSAEKEKINQHIVDYIKESYLSSEDNFESTILITGPWGSGKTHFINETFPENVVELTNDRKYKVIKTSVFGMSTIADLNAAIIKEYSSLFISSLNSKVKNQKLKTTLFEPIKEKWDDYKGYTKPLQERIFKSMGTIDILDISKDNNILLIIDDIERTNIQEKELFGFINKLVLSQKYRVILIANESEIIKEKHFPSYKRYKEKIVGKSFELQHKDSEVLDRFIDSCNQAKEYLKTYSNTIIEVYRKANYNNLRHLGFAIRDFEIFYKTLNDFDTFDNSNPNLAVDIIKVYFMLYIENMQGSLSFENLIILDAEKNAEDKKHTRVDDKYDFAGAINLFFSKELWEDIINRSIIDFDRMKKEFNKSVYVKLTDDEIEPWKALLYFRDINEEDFPKYYEKVVAQLANGEITDAKIFLHMLGITLLFSLFKIIPKSYNEIEKDFSEYIKITDFQIKKLDDDLHLGNAAYGVLYTQTTNSTFKTIKTLLVAKLLKISETEIEKLSVKFLNHLSDLNIKTLVTGFNIESKNQEFLKWPVFKYIDPLKFYNEICKVKNSEIHRFLSFLSERTMVESNLQNLHEELEFWEKFDQLIATQKSMSIKSWALNQFKKNELKSIISRLKTAKETVITPS